jgi:SAM-dependent methyltransferase
MLKSAPADLRAKWVEAWPRINKIEGWMSHIDSWWLCETAGRVPADGTIVEIGSWKGRSTASLMTGFLGNRLYSVDLWMGTAGPYEGGYTNAGDAAYQEFVKNMMFYVGRVPNILHCDSLKAARVFDDASVDVVFHDANHSADAVENDVRAWIPKLKPDGILCGHDWTGKENSVQNGLARLFPLNLVQTSGDIIWWVERAKLG